MNYNFNYISRQLRAIKEPAIHHTHKFEKKLDYRVYKNAYVAPYFDWDKSIGCVIDEKGKVVKDSECLEWKENERYYHLDKSICEHKKVVFLGFILTGFGHSYTDDLRKLWFLETNECKTLLSEGAGLVYTTSWNRSLPKQVIDIFGLAYSYKFEGAFNANGLNAEKQVVMINNIKPNDIEKIIKKIDVFYAEICNKTNKQTSIKYGN